MLVSAHTTQSLSARLSESSLPPPPPPVDVPPALGAATALLFLCLFITRKLQEAHWHDDRDAGRRARWVRRRRAGTGRSWMVRLISEDIASLQCFLLAPSSFPPRPSIISPHCRRSFQGFLCLARRLPDAHAQPIYFVNLDGWLVFAPCESSLSLSFSFNFAPCSLHSCHPRLSRPFSSVDFILSSYFLCIIYLHLSGIIAGPLATAIGRHDIWQGRLYT
jgi:hypothetical protein